MPSAVPSTTARSDATAVALVVGIGVKVWSDATCRMERQEKTCVAVVRLGGPQALPHGALINAAA